MRSAVEGATCLHHSARAAFSGHAPGLNPVHQDPGAVPAYRFVINSTYLNFTFVGHRRKLLPVFSERRWSRAPSASVSVAVEDRPLTPLFE